MKQCHQCGSAVQDETTVREPSEGNLSKNLPPGSFPVSNEKNHFEENRDLQIKSVLLTVGILLITAIFTCGILLYLQDNGYITQLHRNRNDCRKRKFTMGKRCLKYNSLYIQ